MLFCGGGAVTVVGRRTGRANHGGHGPVVQAPVVSLRGRLRERDYAQLAKFLSQRTGHDVSVTFSESLSTALREKTGGHAELVIGKESVVVSDGRTSSFPLTPIARLTGKDGKTTQTGLVVVRSADPATSLEELNGYRILFGPSDCDEKHSAVIRLLEQANVSIPDELETTAACSEGACQIIEWGDDERAAAVISSYAKPLLEGCGTIEKGDLRVIAETEPVPFITVFVNAELPTDVQDELRLALLDVVNHADLRESLESLLGFVAVKDAVTPVALKKN